MRLLFRLFSRMLFFKLLFQMERLMKDELRHQINSTPSFNSYHHKQDLIAVQRAPRKLTSHAVRKKDSSVLKETEAWFRQGLLCVAGRREFNLNRYAIAIADKNTVRTIFDSFTAEVGRHEKTACLFVFNDERFYDGCSDVRSTFHYLAEQMQPISSISPTALANGNALSSSISLRCPVTGVLTTFDDFECVAFCPQSSNWLDPLYDPLMSSPFPSVNLSSDIFAFSFFVKETAQSLLGKDIALINDISRLSNFFDICITRWHKIASRTIGNFEAVTDTKKCPVHITADGDHWVAAHKDPAFAELEKSPHRHELPNIYGHRVAERWLRHFSGIETYAADGLAMEGIQI